MHDLADDPAQQPRIERMMDQLRAWQRIYGDSLPLSSDDPKDPAFTPPTGEALDSLLKRWHMSRPG
jgi:hypothetical protein